MLELQWLDAALGGIFGLILGSFLNVVIHRLPLMMEQQWAREYADANGAPSTANAADTPAALSLIYPASRCPHCGHQIRWFENIPVLSYAVLGGRCSACKAKISPRYPIVELVTGALFLFCFARWGINPTGLAWCGFAAAVLTLALIDWDTTLLPDSITLPLVWAGLIAAMLRWTATPLEAALWGAVAGYMSLWTIYWVFKLLTGKEGMGFGDFKLFAALGAWFGWQALVPIILMASVIGAVVGIAMKINSQLREGGYVPFGPFLAGAGLTAMFFGPESILRFVGL
jgi:leader peptidase (prepilin peptidase)/N-methyltransferase